MDRYFVCHWSELTLKYSELHFYDFCRCNELVGRLWPISEFLFTFMPCVSYVLFIFLYGLRV